MAQRAVAILMNYPLGSEGYIRPGELAKKSPDFPFGACGKTKTSNVWRELEKKGIVEATREPVTDQWNRTTNPTRIRLQRSKHGFLNVYTLIAQYEELHNCFLFGRYITNVALKRDLAKAKTKEAFSPSIYFHDMKDYLKEAEEYAVAHLPEGKNQDRVARFELKAVIDLVTGKILFNAFKKLIQRHEVKGKKRGRPQKPRKEQN